MPATPISVGRGRTGYQYDGTNSAQLASAIRDFTVVAEDTNGLTFTSNGQNLMVPRNGYVVAQDNSVAQDAIFATENAFRNDPRNDVNAEGDHWHGMDHVHEVTITTGPAKPASDGTEATPA